MMLKVLKGPGNGERSGFGGPEHDAGWRRVSWIVRETGFAPTTWKLGGLALRCIRMRAWWVPGMISRYWTKNLRKYRHCDMNGCIRWRWCGPETAAEQGKRSGTHAAFTKVIEEISGEHRSNGCWIHARWKEPAEEREATACMSFREREREDEHRKSKSEDQDLRREDMRALKYA